MPVYPEEQYQEGSQGTHERLNRATGERETVPRDPATTPAPGVVDENPPLDNEATGRKKVELGERPTVESVRGSEHPVVDENYRPVSDPEKHDGPVFEYSPTVSDTAETTDDDEISAEENVPAETKTDEERRAEVEGTTRENEVAATLEREGDTSANVRTTSARTTDEGDTYEQDKAAATANVPSQASNKQEIRDYLIYEHGIDPDDLQDQTKSELLDWVESLKK